MNDKFRNEMHANIDLPSFEIRNVECWSVEIDELEQKHFQNERVLVFAFRSMKLYNNNKHITRNTVSISSFGELTDIC